MPLSEREKKILDEIEKGLSRDDPSRGRAPRRLDQVEKLKLAGALLAAGALLLIAFFFSGWVIFGVAAFGAMVGGMVLAAGAISSAAPRGGDLSKGLRERLGRAWSQQGKRTPRFRRPR
jgi:hypothetical protein